MFLFYIVQLSLEKWKTIRKTMGIKNNIHLCLSIYKKKTIIANLFLNLKGS